MFIKLNTSSNPSANNSFFINAYSICYLVKLPLGSRVFFTMNDTLDVIETVDEIMAMAEKVK